MADEQGFIVVIPARMASTRLPNKPLADIAGIPMVVRVAQRAALSEARRVIVAADDQLVVDACHQHGIHAIITSQNHASGSDRLAQACKLLELADHEVVVNVQGDEPMIEPSMINQVAGLLIQRQDCAISTVAHEILDPEEFLNPNVVKVVIDSLSNALYFSRAPIPWWRDGFANSVSTLHAGIKPLRHVGLYAYRVDFLKRFPLLEVAPLEMIESLEQLRAMWHGYKIVVHTSEQAPGPGVDTPADLVRVQSFFAA